MSDNESIIWGLIRNHQEKKARKRMLENIDVENENRKAIVRYQPSQIEAFFSPYDPRGNIIVSGGDQTLRNRAVLGAVHAIRSNNVPTIVLHIGNSLLEGLIGQQFSNATIFNRNTARYEPFMGLSNLEINRIIQSSATKMCEIRSGAQYYIEGITDFIRTKNIQPYCEMYITCPHLELFDKIDEAEMRGSISADVAQRIKTSLGQGQGQKSDVENYFNVLRHQAQGLIAPRSNISKSTSLRNVINQKGIAVVDVGSNTNELLINLLVEDLTSALHTGIEICVVLDGIKISSSEKLERFVQTSGTTINSIISTDDIYSMLNADDNLFASTLGKSRKTVIFQHQSGLTCTKIADFIGHYEKLEINRQYTHGTNHQSMFTVIPGQMDNDTIGVTPKREHRVRPEEINSMAKDEVYIVDSSNNELAFTQVI